MTTIITVHGTNAGDPADRGDQWWQVGSDFQQKLQLLVAQPINFVPFHWSGANSENDRREASRKLLGLMSKRGKAGEEVGVIGHSHGGSVLAETLRVSRLPRYPFGLSPHKTKENLDQLAFWATVGTPFINYKKLSGIRLSIMENIEGVRPVLSFLILNALIIFSSFVLIPLYIWLAFEKERTGGLALLPLDTLPLNWWFTATFIIAFVASAAFIFGTMTRKAKFSFRRATQNNKIKYLDGIRSAFQSNWISIWDKSDEAINALLVAHTAKTKLTPEKIGSGAFSLMLGLVFATLVFLGMQLLHAYYIKVEMPAFSESHMWFDSMKKYFEFGVGNNLASGAVFLGYAFLGAILLRPVGKILSKTISDKADSVISGLVRDKTLGTDIPGLNAPVVATGPVEFDQAWAALPEDVSKAIHDYSNQFAADLLARARTALGFVHSGLASEEILRQASESITWRELIHTAYFDVDEFIKLLAYASHNTARWRRPTYSFPIPILRR